MSYQTSVCIAPTNEQAVKEFDEHFARHPRAADQRKRTAIGTPEEIAGWYATILATGIDGVTVNAQANGRIEGRVALLGQTLAPLMPGR